MQAMKLINLTAHPINFNGYSIPASGTVARVETKDCLNCTVKTRYGYANIFSQEVGAVFGLPDPEPNTFYIVSSIVRMMAKRDDLISPQIVRNMEGKVVGCSGFLR